jgi:uncharacterized OB-fold protein
MAKQDASKSPLAVYREYCERGELAYQVCTDDGSVVFFPRLTAPGTGSPNLEWRVSKGLGTVYATTTLHRRGEDPYDISMVELDEGFKMMSRVESIDPMDVKIGMRVKVRMIPGTEKQPAYPVFDPVEG